MASAMWIKHKEGTKERERLQKRSSSGGWVAAIAHDTLPRVDWSPTLHARWFVAAP